MKYSFFAAANSAMLNVFPTKKTNRIKTCLITQQGLKNDGDLNLQWLR